MAAVSAGVCRTTRSSDVTTAQQAGIRERVRATRDMEAVRELGMQGGANVVVDVHVEHKRSNAAGSGLEWINATAVGTKGSGADGEVWLVARENC